MRLEPNLICHTYSFPPIIICRFILDLRQVIAAGSSRFSGNQSASLRFVGNAGESLQFGSDEDEEHEKKVSGYLSQAQWSGISVANEEEDRGMASDGHAAELVSARTLGKGRWVIAGTPHVVIQSKELITNILNFLGI